MVSTSTGLKLDNQIHLLELDEDSASQVVKRASFVHSEGEIWQLAAHPDSQATGLFATRFSRVGSDGSQTTGAAVWKRPESGSEGGGQGQLGSPACRVSNTTSDSGSSQLSFLSWSPAQSSRMMVLHENQVLLSCVD